MVGEGHSSEPQASHLTWYFISECLLNDECAPDEYGHLLHCLRERGSQHCCGHHHTRVCDCDHSTISIFLWIKVCALSRVWLWNPMRGSPSGSSVMGFSRQEYWSGLPCPLSGDLPDPGFKPTSFVSPAPAGRFFTAALSGEPPVNTGAYYTPSLSEVGLRAKKQLMGTVWEPGLGPHPGWFWNSCL